MKKHIMILLVCWGGILRVSADEGMWLLPYLQQLNTAGMRAAGLKLPVQEIYDAQKSSLSDAVVIFGGGCTGSIISPEGLLLTNYHCGFGQIQSLSTLENNFLEEGFWAMSRREELPAPGLSVTFIRQMEDVTDRIVPHLSDSLTESEREHKANVLIRAIVREHTPPESTRQASVVPLFNGNRYLLVVKERYEDVRLVGAPPQSVGKFGGDTDNWMWPRHTGDFALFRVYAAPDGRTPAEYAPDNVPYRADRHLKISLRGYREGDFAMILGFPGSTNRFSTSWELDEATEVMNPIRILVRGERQRILAEEMAADERVRLQYASKYTLSSNYWKNSIGVTEGIEKLRLRERKEAEEASFRMWVEADTARAAYREALPLIRDGVTERRKPIRKLQYLEETLLQGVELLGLVFQGHTLLQAEHLPDTARREALKDRFRDRYKDYDSPTDRRVAKRMLTILRDSLPGAFPELDSLIALYGGDPAEARPVSGVPDDIARFVDSLYARSAFTTPERFAALMQNVDSADFDPGYGFFRVVLDTYKSLLWSVRNPSVPVEHGQRLYVAGIMEMEPARKFYPDANMTMRLTYGRVAGYPLPDGTPSGYRTDLEGVLAKEDPANPDEFTVDDRLKQLAASRDYGRYGAKRKIAVNFLSDNDITGGNSGSPVLNARGELIGLAFDGNWEAVMSDLVYEPQRQRTISVDIRYVLLLIDRIGGARHLIREMTIVR